MLITAAITAAVIVVVLGTVMTIVMPAMNAFAFTIDADLKFGGKSTTGATILDMTNVRITGTNLSRIVLLDRDGFDPYIASTATYLTFYAKMMYTASATDGASPTEWRVGTVSFTPNFWKLFLIPNQVLTEYVKAYDGTANGYIRLEMHPSGNLLTGMMHIEQIPFPTTVN